jgi:hypothetical protein
MLKSTFLFLVILVSLTDYGFSEENINSKKTLVHVGVYLNHIDKIDVKAQTFYAEFYLNMKWKGNHSANNFEFMNANNSETFFLQEWTDKDTNWLACKVRGTFRCKMDVSNFPLDEQKLIIQLGDFVWIEDSLTYVVNPSVTGRYKEIYSAEWDILDYSANVVEFKEMGDKYSVLECSVNVERRTTSFLIKILIPILIVMGVSMLNLFIDKKQLEACIGLGVTSLLSIIALYFSISDSLPDVNYATTVDKMMMGSYLVIFITMVEIVYAHNLVHQNKKELLNKIENISKWLIPSGYLLFLFLLFMRVDILWFIR